MAQITLVRTDHELPADPEAARQLLFGVVDGFTQQDKRAWRRFWRRFLGMRPGEMATAEWRFPRSGPFHRFHMRLEQGLFDHQDRFTNFEQFRVWLKVGAGWVDWCAGPKGGVVPIPRSISYAKADEDEFRRFHDQVMEFLRGPHAADYLWPHMKGEGATAMMESLLETYAPELDRVGGQ